VDEATDDKSTPCVPDIIFPTVETIHWRLFVNMWLPVCLALLVSVSAAHAQTPEALVQKIKASPGYQAAAAFLETDYDRFVRELVTLTEIPAPPFKESARAAAYLQMLKDAGLTEVEQDPEGNVMGIWKGAGSGGPMLAVLSHLDTVFPEGTDVKVKREGTRLAAPGIGDDTRALAMMLTAIRAMRAGKLQTVDDILFVGNVGEEGEGDLRGVKYLLTKGKYKDRIRQMIAIDGGAQGNMTNGALGSKRYRVTFKGPGGHSYGAFGLVSPSLAMGNAIQKFSRVQVPASPKTTFNVGVVGGGTSVNSIPVDVFMDVDMRSESPAELTKIDTTFKHLVAEAVAEENQARSTAQGKVAADIKLIGDRPSGTTATDTMLIQTVTAAVKSYGLEPSYETSSTDANIPISMGIPAVTIGRGGPGGRGHSLDEWTDVEKKGAIQAALVAVTIFLAAAGMP
jgi:acetylornithine deacetylase/succinyl-diaminopimelate desuccinylase-like protein